MEEFKSFNKVVIVGYVVNYTIYTFKSGKRKAEIGIKDEMTNNICYVQMFESDKMKYAGNPANLDTLNRIFMDSDGKPRHVLVNAIGRVAENSYVSAKSGQTVVSCKPTIWKIEPFNDVEDQQVTFSFTGIVDNMKYVKDDTEIVVRLGMITTNRDKEYTGVEFIKCTIDGEMLDRFEELGIDKGYQITVVGDILNRFPKKDRYGRTPEGAVAEKGFKVIDLRKSFVSVDDLDMDLYKRLKNGNTEQLKDSGCDLNKDQKVPDKETSEDVSSDVRDIKRSIGDSELNKTIDGLDF